MNADNLRRVADAIENHEIKWLGFNMVNFVSDDQHDNSGHECGTTACIGGWAFAILSEKVCNYEDLVSRSYLPLEREAAKLLGLIGAERKELFYENPIGVDFEEVTPAMAVNTLRYAADHGVVDWDAANPSEVS